MFIWMLHIFVAKKSRQEALAHDTWNLLKSWVVAVVVFCSDSKIVRILKVIFYSFGKFSWKYEKVEWILNRYWMNVEWVLNQCWMNIESMLNECMLNGCWMNVEWMHVEWILNAQMIMLNDYHRAPRSRRCSFGMDGGPPCDIVHGGDDFRKSFLNSGGEFSKVVTFMESMSHRGPPSIP